MDECIYGGCQVQDCVYQRYNSAMHVEIDELNRCGTHSCNHPRDHHKMLGYFVHGTYYNVESTTPSKVLPNDVERFGRTTENAAVANLCWPTATVVKKENIFNNAPKPTPQHIYEDRQSIFKSAKKAGTKHPAMSQITPSKRVKNAYPNVQIVDVVANHVPQGTTSKSDWIHLCGEEGDKADLKWINFNINDECALQNRLLGTSLGFKFHRSRGYYFINPQRKDGRLPSTAVPIILHRLLLLHGLMSVLIKHDLS